MSSRARVILLNAALGPLDYRVPHGMQVTPGSIIVVPLGPRQLVGVVWEEDSFPDVESVGDNRLRNIVGPVDAPPIPETLRRLIEWTADYYLAPVASVLRMTLASMSALEGARTVIEYKRTGALPDRMTDQRTQAMERIGERQAQWRHMAAQREVRRDALGHHVRPGRLDAFVHVRAPVTPGPAIESAVLHRSEVVGHQVAAQLVAFVDRHP